MAESIVIEQAVNVGAEDGPAAGLCRLNRYGPVRPCASFANALNIRERRCALGIDGFPQMNLVALEAGRCEGLSEKHSAAYPAAGHAGHLLGLEDRNNGQEAEPGLRARHAAALHAIRVF